MLCFCFLYFLFFSFLFFSFVFSDFFSELKIVCAKNFNVNHDRLEQSAIANSNEYFNQNAIVAKIKMKKVLPTNASLTITIISHSLFTLFFYLYFFFSCTGLPSFSLFPLFLLTHHFFSSQENSFWFYSIVFSLHYSSSLLFFLSFRLFLLAVSFLPLPI